MHIIKDFNGNVRNSEIYDQNFRKLIQLFLRKRSLKRLKVCK